MMQNERPESVKSPRNYNAEFKQKMTRILASGRSSKGISEAFGIAEKRYAVVASLSLEENGNKKD